MSHLRSLAGRAADLLRIPGSASRFAGWRRRAYPDGISLLGYSRAETGMGEAVRSSARALGAAGVGFDLLRLDTGTGSLQRDMSLADFEVTTPAHGNLLVNVNADSLARVLRSLPRRFVRGRFIIAHWTWELPRFPSRWRGAFDHVDEVWVPSRFVQDAVAAVAPVPVRCLPYCVGAPAVAPVRARERFGLPGEGFLFLSMFDPLSFVRRKHPGAVLDAFASAFGRRAGGAGLVIKLNRPAGQLPAGFNGSDVEALLARARQLPGVHVIDEVLDRAGVEALMTACDCFVSLHRAEGFGLSGAESFALGRPVIQTAWSGNLDYHPAGSPGAVACHLVPVGAAVGPYDADVPWAEPDVEDAARWMRAFAGDPRFAARCGAEGRERVAAGFSPAAVGRRMAARLRELGARVPGDDRQSGTGI